MLKNLAKKLTNNLGLKVLAVLFAIALWIVVVNIDDPVKQAQYTISVTQDNMDYLTSNGKYSETLGGKNTVTFTASAKRSIAVIFTACDRNRDTAYAITFHIFNLFHIRNCSIWM